MYKIYQITLYYKITTIIIIKYLIYSEKNIFWKVY